MSRCAVRAKAKGIHYTPPELATFLAKLALRAAEPKPRLAVLDPACGDGALLRAIAEQVEIGGFPPCSLWGLDTDRAALEQAREAVSLMEGVDFHLRCVDFIAHTVGSTAPQRKLFPEGGTQMLPTFDIVISNPPYVRTQVLGSAESRRLADLLNLSGRVDLYHAFVKAMSLSLRVGGTLALLCSNRFLSTRSGESVRSVLLRDYILKEVIDLGDTRLFGAAVLPAIVIAERSSRPSCEHVPFTRVYESSTPTCRASAAFASIPAALEKGAAGLVRVSDRDYEIERGELARPAASSSPWRVSTPEADRWLETVHANAVATLADVVDVRVGIKTTADRVFIREDWHDLPPELRPEEALLRPLITHHVAQRWFVPPKSLSRSVLYTHVRDGRRKRPVDLRDYPRAAAYLEQYRERLQDRSYLAAAGRAWFEIWVPQDPDAWQEPKVVGPDIAESPTFFLDESGAVVNGDCYWMTLKQGADRHWLLMVLAVLNSSFAVRYYDAVCGNRLYAGRRRFMTQYLERFPLPALDGTAGESIARLTRKLVSPSGPRGASRAELERKVDALVLRRLGLSE